MMKYKASGKELPFDFFRSYDYYKVGRDVTKEIYDIIDKYKHWGSLMATDYTKVIKSMDFYFLVKNGGPLDLKNRADFKTNSTYIFEGEIVDADALGNIVYGRLGKFYGFNDFTLLAGGGFAQTVARTSDKEFKEYNYDDPKDQFRILQGIKLIKNLRGKKIKNIINDKGFVLNDIPTPNFNSYII